VINEAAAERAAAAGMTVVMHRCIHVDRARMPA
jgi:predicted CoA-binding protein